MIVLILMFLWNYQLNIVLKFIVNSQYKIKLIKNEKLYDFHCHIVIFDFIFLKLK